jgi:hypothetical protein
MADRSEKPIAQCIDEILKLRPQVETRHLFVGAVTSKGLRKHLDTLIQAERDKLFDHVLEAVLGRKDVVRGRLGATNFTVLSSQDLSDLLGLEPDAIEKSINEALAHARTAA